MIFCHAWLTLLIDIDELILKISAEEFCGLLFIE